MGFCTCGFVRSLVLSSLPAPTILISLLRFRASPGAQLSSPVAHSPHKFFYVFYLTCLCVCVPSGCVCPFFFTLNAFLLYPAHKSASCPVKPSQGLYQSCTNMDCIYSGGISFLRRHSPKGWRVRWCLCVSVAQLASVMWYPTKLHAQVWSVDQQPQHPLGAGGNAYGPSPLPTLESGSALSKFSLGDPCESLRNPM